jgi:hypothetical protein
MENTEWYGLIFVKSIMMNTVVFLRMGYLIMQRTECFKDIVINGK